MINNHSVHVIKNSIGTPRLRKEKIKGIKSKKKKEYQQFPEVINVLILTKEYDL